MQARGCPFSGAHAHTPPYALSNLQVYVYTRSPVTIAVLELFVKREALLPNLFVGAIRRDSILAALARWGHTGIWVRGREEVEREERDGRREEREGGSVGERTGHRGGQPEFGGMALGPVIGECPRGLDYRVHLEDS